MVTVTKFSLIMDFNGDIVIFSIIPETSESEYTLLNYVRTITSYAWLIEWSCLSDKKGVSPESL